MLPICPVKDILIYEAVKEIIRKLPAEGEIFVKKGDKVEPDDFIGECKIPSGFRVFNLSESLGIPPEKIQSCLLKKIGSHVYRGGVIASSAKFFGLQKREFVSPVEGILDNLNEKGQITIRFFPRSFKLPAGMYGVVKEVEGFELVVIETAAAVIKGVLGIGYSREGPLSILGGPDEVTEASLVDANLSGKILVCGSLLTKNLIQKALSVGVVGIIGGGMHLRDFRSIAGTFSPSEDIGVSLMITGAYGELPLGRKVYTFLSHFGHHHVILNPQDLEFIIPLSQEVFEKLSKQKTKGQEKRGEFLKKGMMVRVLSWPHLGKIGTVDKIGEELTTYESGLSGRAVEVYLTKDLKVQVPPQNLEIIA